MTTNTKRVCILLGITAVAAGGYVAYNLYKKKKNAQETIDIPVKEGQAIPENENKEDETVEQPDKFIFGDNISMMPEQVEVERTEYATKAAKYSEKEPGELDPDEDSSEDEETFEAFQFSKEYDAYRKKNKNKIIVLPEGQIEYTWNREIGNDPEDPDICYEEEELYYFTEDETLTDEDGHIIDEEQYLGVKPRQFGWFNNDKEDIYIRNNPLERDFRVNKVHAERSAYF